MKLVVILFVVLASAAFGQTADRPDHLRITLPTNIDLKVTRISHFMTGPFGGLGTDGRLRVNPDIYEVALTYEGKRAKASKGFIYMPGCELFTWDVQLQHGSDLELKPRCEPRSSLSFKGRIVGERPEGENAQVVVYYLAAWAHDFYGIKDGAIPMIEVHKIPLNAAGEFDITLPDLFNDPAHLKWQRSQGSKPAFALTLRNAKTWNIQAWLRPADSKDPSNDLEIRPSYPAVVEFVTKVEEKKPKQQ